MKKLTILVLLAGLLASASLAIAGEKKSHEKGALNPPSNKSAVSEAEEKAMLSLKNERKAAPSAKGKNEKKESDKMGIVMEDKVPQK